ncbi:millepora cytotoxin-1-like [Mytilus californianus]|uniref:millepora cytotoxin-1-like n=1 Tax=Mytilus californianus TaxID=6549 RepID=UPI00224808B7|nr:millepora cytotoxin-1-like [Mytilus californianus]
MMLKLPIICLICTLNLVVGWRWVNKYDGPVDFSCPHGQAISFIYSVHHNHYEDRRWAFECRGTGGQYRNCYWTPHYVNDWDDFFNFECHNYGFITGMKSIHHNHYEDRRFRFKCCSISEKDLSKCYKTFRNDYDQPNKVDVPAGSVVRGVASTHNNHYEDRQFNWKMRINCQQCLLEIQ